jgi:LTXXQ motif family protein
MGSQMMQRGMEQGRMGQGMAGPGMMGGDMMGGGMMGGMMQKMMGAGAGHTEGRLAFIKTELKITDAQMSQWNAFADAVRANGAAMADMGRSMMSQHASGSTLPERLAAEDKALGAHYTAFKKTTEALNNLYGVLSPEQKKIADGIIVGPMGMPMGMM